VPPTGATLYELARSACGKSIRRNDERCRNRVVRTYLRELCCRGTLNYRTAKIRQCGWYVSTLSQAISCLCTCVYFCLCVCVCGLCKRPMILLRPHQRIRNSQWRIQKFWMGRSRWRISPVIIEAIAFFGKCTNLHIRVLYEKGRLTVKFWS